MALSEKQRRALKLAEKRRANRPVTDFKEPVSLKVTHGERERFTRSYPKVLLAIESTLAESFLANSEIDDQDVLAALKCCIRQQDSEEQRVILLIRALQQSKEDVIGYHENADEIWTNGLRIIHQSVGTHSNGRPNDQSYLRFAVSFVAHAVRPRLT